jgi:hypothetical protein
VTTSQPERDADQIQADLGATRDRLAAAVETLVDRIHPQRIKQREINGAKHFAHDELENLKALLFTARGDLRTDRLAAVGGAVAGAVGLLLVLRALVRRLRTR